MLFNIPYTRTYSVIAKYQFDVLLYKLGLSTVEAMKMENIIKSPADV
ncbi:hypothetical protein HDF23_004223 [Mucilaginibacter lappiensis]|uniref:Uncharacterized protein n=1 Tax=Mucilaginibacter lappiensis TaxID=354630 RepID=A0ABR6PNV4_9SPHI|nr:hypothetical protein [Mucilaginibacter lappiensis]MBB6111453.1 hypothetical protein [Mucilaginibacter lappiensis]